MPTAAKLVASVLLAILLWWISTTMLVPNLPEGQSQGVLVPILVVLAALIGWRFVGRHAGQGWQSSFGIGITGAAVILGLGAVIFATARMYHLATVHRYHAPSEAVLDIFPIAADYVMEVVTIEAAMTLVLGCMAASLFAEIASRLWK